MKFVSDPLFMLGMSTLLFFFYFFISLPSLLSPSSLFLSPSSSLPFLLLLTSDTGKELLLSVVEVVLVFEGQSSGGIYDKFDCYKACMTTHGYILLLLPSYNLSSPLLTPPHLSSSLLTSYARYKTSYTCDYPQQYAALCHDQCNYSFNSCHLVDVRPLLPSLSSSPLPLLSPLPSLFLSPS